MLAGYLHLPLVARPGPWVRAAEETYRGQVLDLNSLDLEEIANALADRTNYEHPFDEQRVRAR